MIFQVSAQSSMANHALATVCRVLGRCAALFNGISHLFSVCVNSCPSLKFYQPGENIKFSGPPCHTYSTIK
jgi:hypothetical protein